VVMRNLRTIVSLCLMVKIRIPVAVMSKTWDRGQLLAGVASSKPTGGLDVCLSVASVVCS
jgi:hypothetical protein